MSDHTQKWTEKEIENFMNVWNSANHAADVLKLPEYSSYTYSSLLDIVARFRKLGHPFVKGNERGRGNRRKRNAAKTGKRRSMPNKDKFIKDWNSARSIDALRSIPEYTEVSYQSLLSRASYLRKQGHNVKHFTPHTRHDHERFKQIWMECISENLYLEDFIDRYNVDGCHISSARQTARATLGLPPLVMRPKLIESNERFVKNWNSAASLQDLHSNPEYAGLKRETLSSRACRLRKRGWELKRFDSR